MNYINDYDCDKTNNGISNNVGNNSNGCNCIKSSSIVVTTSTTIGATTSITVSTPITATTIISASTKIIAPSIGPGMYFDGDHLGTYEGTGMMLLRVEWSVLKRFCR